MKVSIRRSGGFAGLGAVEALLDTAALSAEERTRLERLAHLAAEAPGEERARPDAHTYAVRIEAPDSTRSASVSEADAGPELRELLHWAIRRGSSAHGEDR